MNPKNSAANAACILAMLLPACACLPLSGCSGAQPRTNAGSDIRSIVPYPLPVWYTDLDAWRRDNNIRIRGNLLISSGEGRSQQEARTNAHKAAVEKIGAADRADLTQHGQIVTTYKNGTVSVTILYEHYTPDAAEILGEAVRRLCGELVSLVQKDDRPGLSLIAVGDFTYMDTGISSEFGELLRTRMLAELQKQVGLDAAGREHLLQRFPADIVVRILKDDELRPTGADEADDRNADNPALPDAVVSGTFWPRTAADEVHVEASIRRLSGAMLGGASATITLGGLEVSVRPNRDVDAMKILDEVAALKEIVHSGGETGNDLKIQLWPQDARTLWREGECIIFHFRSNRDCHLNLLHVNSDGNVQLLFPNRWHSNTLIRGGQTYSIPSAEMDFDLVIRPPFGTDTIMALATTGDAPLYRHQVGSNVIFRSIPGGLDTVRQDTTRGLGPVPAGQKAEAVITITTTGR